MTSGRITDCGLQRQKALIAQIIRDNGLDILFFIQLPMKCPFSDTRPWFEFSKGSCLYLLQNVVLTSEVGYLWRFSLYRPLLVVCRETPDLYSVLFMVSRYFSPYINGTRLHLPTGCEVYRKLAWTINAVVCGIILGSIPIPFPLECPLPGSSKTKTFAAGLYFNLHALNMEIKFYWHRE